MPYDIPVDPPKDWFSPPEVIPTDKRITIEPNGRVYGYVALWDTCHVGHNGCVRPPRNSPTNYEYAHQGEAMTAEGEVINIAVVAGGADHAPIDLETAAVPKYYENTGTQLMRVRYGEDKNGLWFAGALWPDVNDLMAAKIRASSISGDWRWHLAYRKAGGSFDFAGACFVNLPGFPMKSKGDIGSYNGQPYALSASSFMTLDKNEEFIFLTEGEENVSDECDGSCNVCTCGKQDDVNEEVDTALTEEQENDILQAAYQLVQKKRKKNGVMKADAIDEESVETVPDVSELNETVKSIKEAVDWLVAEKLSAEISNLEI